MKYRLEFDGRPISGIFKLPASKSISNRLLILEKLSENRIKSKNLSKSADTQELIQVLSDLQQSINTGNGGTSTRFIIAFLSTLPGTWTVSASGGMEKRPISGLVDALINLGAEIKYLEKDNHLPIQIIGGNITKNKVAVSAQVSSQYISALLLIAPSLPNGLQINLIGKIVSRPYIEMTLTILRQLGVDCLWKKNRITVSSNSIQSMTFLIENDWSAASYWYSIAALSKNSCIELLGLDTESMQGDAAVAAIFKQLGVDTEFTKRGIIIKNNFVKNDHLKIDFLDFPDIAPTIITTATALGITGTYTGLDTLEKKESKRIDALKKELSKIGAIVETSLQNKIEIKEINAIKNNNILIETYGDHRMAMAFAPLVTVMSSIVISNPKVVEKSYPDFWNELKKAGISIDEINEP